MADKKPEGMDNKKPTSDNKKPDNSSKKPDNTNKGNQSDIKKKLNAKEMAQKVTKSGAKKAKDAVEAKAAESKAGQIAQKTAAAANKIKTIAVKTANTIKTTALASLKIVASPFFWIGLAVVGVIIIANGASVTVGQNTYETTCGTFSAPQFTTGSVTDEGERGKLIMGHFINDGMTPEQASQLSAYIMQSSKGDSKKNLKDKDCNNKCIISSDKSGIGLIPFSNSDLKELGKFAQKGNADWRDSSTQLRFISNKIKESKNIDKFRDKPTVGNIDTLLGTKFDGNKTTLDTNAKDLSKSYKDEGAECQAIGIGKRRNYWSPTSQGPDGAGAAGKVDMSSLINFAWSYASDTKIKTYGSFKSPNSYPPAVAAMKMAHQVKQDPLGNVLASCDRGVAIGMIATKTDVDFPYGAVEEQYRYMSSNSKYQKVSYRERQPGDIMIWWYDGKGSRASHVTLYVGEMPGKSGEWMVESSYLDYEPMKSQWNFGSGVHRSSSYTVEYWRCTGCKIN